MEQIWQSTDPTTTAIYKGAAVSVDRQDDADDAIGADSADCLDAMGVPDRFRNDLFYNIAEAIAAAAEARER